MSFVVPGVNPRTSGLRMSGCGCGADLRVICRAAANTTGASVPETFSCERPHGHGRGGAARRSRAAEHRQYQEAGFIEANEMSAQPVEFYRDPLPPGSTPARDDCRALSHAETPPQPPRSPASRVPSNDSSLKG